MLTIGVPGLVATLCYMIIIGLVWHLGAYTLAARNPDSAVAKAMLFIF